jgi:acyl-coenzyme A thioesterase PaaI-like protein
MVEKNWVFGEPPLATVVELAGALRDLTDTVQSLERSSPELEALVQTVRDAQRQLAMQGPVDLRPRVGDDPSPDRRVYVDHGYAIGEYNPCFPRYTLELDGGGGAFGTVEFPISYEGPPGVVHGGFLAVFFDCVLQELNCALGLAGKTAELSLRFRRPTPLLTPLTYRAERVVDERRITARAELFRGEELLCEAHLSGAKGEHAALPAVSPRRA